MDGVGSNLKVVESSRRIRYFDGLLRLLGLFLTLAAAILTGVDKETKAIPISISKTLPTVHVSVTAKWHYMYAFVYFLVSNAIAFSYATTSLVASMSVRTSKDKTRMVLVILDMTIMGLLFSANGAAIAIGILGQYGNSHADLDEGVRFVRWILSPNDCCYNLIFVWIIDFLLAGCIGHSQPSQEIKVDDGNQGTIGGINV